ncbi:MAG: HAMP domain-containing sensor histidine kinase [Thermoguttaceae bacterium]|jgi:signal transduction histidine kinase
MFRYWPIWTIFAICLLVVLAAMGWISWTAIRLDRLETEARLQTAQEEKVRLALWRMDTALAPLVAQESARPYFAYKSFFPRDRAFGNMFNERMGGEALIPSPLLSSQVQHILVHFQFEPGGSLTSPQVPPETNWRLAVPRLVSDEAVHKSAKHLAQIKQLLDRNKLLALLPEHQPANVEMVIAPANPLAQSPAQQKASRRQREDMQQAQGQSAVEFQQRSQAVINSANALLQNQKMSQANAEPLPMNSGKKGSLDALPTTSETMPSTDFSGVLMSPLWINGELILARRVSAGGQEYVQGCLLDWPAIRTSLLEAIADLLPAADLVPVFETTYNEGGRLLAALPVRLIPGPLTGNNDGAVSPILLSLTAAWACILMAAAAVAGLLGGVIRLSQRRATFVSAVTHELRTPLTTFQMYAEMLAEGMVADEQKQREYLNTLRAESIRLTHLVENVLAYARLERGRADRRLESIGLEDLLSAFKDRLAGRAEQAGMKLCVEVPDEVSAETVRANIAAVEQILFNLVDNACKYASSAFDKRIDLTYRVEDGMAVVSVRDHGPGLSAGARRRLFRSFSKSAQEAAQSAPGIGLGLALSRRLARDMGGDLLCDTHAPDGACFVLKLPLK